MAPAAVLAAAATCNAAGFSVAESKTIPSQQLLLPQLRMLKDLGINLTELANSYRQGGDTASAQAALRMAATLGQRYSNGGAGETEGSQLVGLWIESNALKSMDPNAAYAGDQTVQQRLDQIAQQNATHKELNQQLEPLLENLSDQDWIIYKDRWRTFGEESAMRWVIGKYGGK